MPQQFGTATLDGYGCGGMTASIAAAGAALRYARETQQSALPHITGIATRIPAGNMALDAITLRNLEITTNIRGSGDGNTLLSILDVTETPMGSRTMRSFVVSPLAGKSAIDARLDAVEYFLDHAIERQELRSILNDLADIERIAGRIAYGNAGPRDLMTLRESLERIPDVKALFDDDDPALVREALDSMSDHAGVIDLVARAIADDPPALAKSGGMIREGFDGKLDELRHLATTGKNWIATFQQQEREKTGIRSLKVSYNRVFGYYIEVTKPNVHLVPPGYERRQTLANAERYTTPDLKEKEAMIATAEERLEAPRPRYTLNSCGRWCTFPTSRRPPGRSGSSMSMWPSARSPPATATPAGDRGERPDHHQGRPPPGGGAKPPRPVRPKRHELDAAGDQIAIITGRTWRVSPIHADGSALLHHGPDGKLRPGTPRDDRVVDRVFTRWGRLTTSHPGSPRSWWRCLSCKHPEQRHTAEPGDPR